MTADHPRWKWIAAGVGALALAAVAAGAVAFRTLVDPQHLVEQARAKAKTAWGRELAIGSLELQFLPRPAVRAERVALANPPWARGKDFLVAGQVTAAFALLPLLSGRLEVTSLDLRDATIDVEEGDDGTTVPARLDVPVQAPGSAQVPFPSMRYLRLEDVRVAIRPKHGPPVTWEVPHGSVESDGALRDVRFEATLARAGRALDIEGDLRDASAWGHEGATSPGHLRIKSPQGSVEVEGTLPLQRSLRGHAVKVRAKGTSMAELLAFAGIERKPTAPFELAVDSRDDDGAIVLSDLRFALGAQRFTGAFRIARGERTRIDGRLATDRLDWGQALVDSGGTVAPDPPTDKLYSDRPMAWWFVESLAGKEGRVELAFASLKLRNGIELKNAKATATFRDNELQLKPFATELLGGTAHGSFAFSGGKKAVRIVLEGERVSYERWLKERGSKLGFSGGPMTVSASIAGAGDSMQDVAGSISGPITLRMGAGRYHSQHAGEVEQMMTHAFAAKDASDIEIECAVAALDFRNGRATGNKIVGFRTAASRLVTSGTVDFREGRIELRGRIAAKKGVSLGLSTLADGIEISGPVRAPRFSLDGSASATGNTLARVGAAIATVGVSVLGTAIVEAASKKDDPCEEVLGAKHE